MAQRIYSVSALLALLYVGAVTGTQTAMRASGTPTLVDFPGLRLLLLVILLPSILGTATLWVGMWYFWFGFDQSHWFKKALWFLGLWLLAPLAALLYYFLVYRNAPLLKAKSAGVAAQAAHGTST